jgi:hypothetical protein
MSADRDDDLDACLRHNPQEGVTPEAIAAVLAVWEGENGDDWRWVVALTDGRFAFIQGGCDYTGWDCQSWATSVVVATPERAAEGALGDVPVSGDGPAGAGLGHALAILTGEYMKNAAAIRDDLLRQLREGKAITWPRGDRRQPRRDKGCRPAVTEEERRLALVLIEATARYLRAEGHADRGRGPLYPWSQALEEARDAWRLRALDTLAHSGALTPRQIEEVRP